MEFSTTKWLVATNLVGLGLKLLPSSPTFHLVGFFEGKGSMSAGSKEIILAAAKRRAMAHGYTGLNFRDIAGEVGIKAPSIYHHFPTKADLGAAVAKRYWEDIVVDLKAISDAVA